LFPSVCSFSFFTFHTKRGDTEFRPTFFRSAKKVGRNRLIFFLQPPKNRKYHLQKWCSFIRLSYLRLKFFVSKGVFIHKITSEGWQTIREGRARLWEP
jgi:hypothetical protein